MIDAMRSIFFTLYLSLSPSQLVAFAPRVSPKVARSSFTSLGARRRVLVKEKTYAPVEKVASTYDPLNLASSNDGLKGATLAAASIAPLTLFAQDAAAASKSLVSTGDLNPESFNPVCPASDGFYRLLQGTTQAVVGDDAFVEYGPLIAGGLLRIRLELCVVESFFNEAVGPFIQKNGISWILPLHETVETFLAGVIFALASTFILVGSTKIVSVLFIYLDVFFGIPSRTLGGFLFDRARGKPVTLDVGVGPFKTRLIGPPAPSSTDEGEVEKEPFMTDADPFKFVVIALSGLVKYTGELLRIITNAAESIDVFVGRYLILFATFYIGIKFLHFKVFPDFPNLPGLPGM